MSPRVELSVGGRIYRPSEGIALNPKRLPVRHDERWREHVLEGQAIDIVTDIILSRMIPLRRGEGGVAMAEVHEIVPGIYRISHFDGTAAPVEFTQFLIKDEKPLLFHTGPKALFAETLEAVKRIVDPADLRYISWSHLESDECGALNEFLAAAPNAEPVHGEIGVMLSVGDFFTKAPRGMGDDEVLDLGEKKLRFMTTPNVPHAWDAILVFEEITRTLFVSDLFTVFGKPPATTETDMVEQSMAALRQLPGYLPIGPHTSTVFERLIALEPKVIAGHHSAAYTGNAVQALRDLRGELFKEAGLVSPK